MIVAWMHDESIVRDCHGVVIVWSGDCVGLASMAKPAGHPLLCMANN